MYVGVCVDRERAVSDILIGSILLPYKLSILFISLLLPLLHFEVLLLVVSAQSFFFYYHFLLDVFITE